MANIQKKRDKLRERIEEIETKMKISLQKKVSGTTAFDIAAANQQLAKLRAELKELK